LDQETVLAEFSQQTSGVRTTDLRLTVTVSSPQLLRTPVPR